MTKKQFWQTASNWGFLGGIFLFAMNLISWGLKLELNNLGWLHELLLFLVICPMIILTGRRNAAASGAEGYSYGRAVGFVFAMMMFAGIVYGAGQFLMYNFIAAEYYGPMLENSIDQVALSIRTVNPSMLDFFIENRELYLSMMRNPFMLIFSNVINIGVKGGFLGLVLCAFLYTKPDIFAGTQAEVKQDNESGSE